VLLTRWPEWFAFGAVTPALQIVGDLIVFLPFPAGAVATWLGAFPVEQALRGWGPRGNGDPEAAPMPAALMKSRREIRVSSAFISMLTSISKILVA
jgi:hypothetical protein